MFNRWSQQEGGREVLIVVPTLNEADHVEDVVASLLDGAPEGAGLVIADGGSTDGTVEKARALAERDPRVRLVSNSRRIQSAAVNRAVEQAGAEEGYLVRADAHAEYPRDFCRTLVREAERTGAEAVAVTLESRGGPGFHAGVAAAQNSVLGTGGSAHRNGGGGRYVDHGHHALIRLEHFRAIGGYDETLSHNEDAEFDVRLVRSGGRIWLAPEPVVGYFPRRAIAALFRQYMSYGKGRASTLLKHRMLPRLRQVLPVGTVPAACLAALGLVLSLGGDLRWLWLGLPAAIWIAASLVYGLVLALRAGSADVAWAGPAAIVMHFAWGLGFIGRLMR